MKLFDIVPSNFSSILSSVNREIYYDALMVLNDMFKFDLNIRVDDYISSLIYVLEDRMFELEDEEDIVAIGTGTGKARLILNRLIKTGWVDKEFIEYDSDSQADEEITNAIDYILKSYQSIGGLVNEIDRKHSSYTKSSIEKIKYLMTADQTIKGKLAEILKSYATMTEENREQLANILENNIHVDRQYFFDAQSLYHKSARNLRIDREPFAYRQIRLQTR